MRLQLARELADAAGLLATMIVILVIGIVVDAAVRAADNALRRRWGLQQVRNSPASRDRRICGSPPEPSTRCEPPPSCAAPPGPVPAEKIAVAQDIPRRFLDNILLQLRRAGLIHSQRGPDGGYWLARPARRSPGRRDHGGRRQSGTLRARRLPGSPARWPTCRARCAPTEEAAATEITLAHIAKDSASLTARRPYRRVKVLASSDGPRPAAARTRTVS